MIERPLPSASDPAVPTTYIDTASIPPPREAVVPPRRLIARLDEGLGGRLIIVSAAAGSGKTTLLARWARGCARRGVRVAWMTAEPRHDDPTRFWCAMIAALERARPGAFAHARTLLRAPSAPDGEAVATALASALAAASAEVAFIVDDYHRITAEDVHEGLAHLLDHLPPRVHVVVAGRADPPHPIARLRAAGQVAEIRTDDLRLTRAEARAFLIRDGQPAMVDAEFDELWEQTRGWAAGLWLASLAARRARTPGEAPHDRRRFTFDYLFQEVLDQQPTEIQTFLLRTSILDRLCAPLCDSVAGTSESERILSSLRSASLFVSPLDVEGGWFAYHPIFAGALRERLAQREPDMVASLHRRAAAWLTSSDIDAAVEHALAAGDRDVALDLVEGAAERAIARGELATVAHWVDALPPGARLGRPRLGLDHAWALAHTGRLDAAEATLHRVRETLEAQRDGTISRLWGNALAVGARIAALRRDVDRTVALSRQALAHGGAEPFQTRGDLTLNLAFGLYDGGQDDAAIGAFAEAWVEARDGGNARAALLACRYRAIIEILHANLARAAELCEEALAWAASLERQPAPAAALVHATLGELLYEWDDLASAERHATDGVALGRLGGDRKALVASYSLLARVLWARGDAAGADALLLEAEAFLGARPFAAIRVALLLAAGAVTEAARWSRRHGLTAPGDPSDVDGALVRASLARAEGRTDDARGLLDAALALAEERGRTGAVIRVLTFKATILGATGRSLEACEAARRAIELAEPAGFVRTFVDEGAPVRAILEQLIPRLPKEDRVAAYAATLLAAARKQAIRARCSPSSATHGAEFVEPISERERRVLVLVAEGKSNREIAHDLIVSLNTVKTHLRNLYAKLGAHSRSQAAAYARARGLL